MAPCPYCDDLKFLLLVPGTFPSSSLECISSSAEQGCEGCSVLLKGIDFFWPPKSYGNLRETIRIDHETDLIGDKRYRQSFGVCIEWQTRPQTAKGQPWLEPRPWQRCRIEFFANSGRDLIHHNILRMPKISGNTASSDALSWAKEKMLFCIANHQRCQPPQDSPLPTRLIFVGNPSEDGSERVLLLRETTDLPHEPMSV